MGNIFNPDFREFLSALNKAEVRYVLVGGYSVIIHGYPRTTGDMDIWVDRTPENYQRLQFAFQIFGMPVFDMTSDNFLNHKTWNVFTFGIPPVAIDIMVELEDFSFEDIFSRAVWFEDTDVRVWVIHKHDLIDAKRKTGRTKDLNDLENL